MASPSTSPSGSSRCLAELLDLQQEPFSLDLYLLEKGCSSPLLDAAGGACSTCWPWSSGRTGVRPAAIKKWSCVSGVLLCKILRGKVIPPTAKKKQRRPPATNRHRYIGGAKQRTSDDLQNSAPPHRAVEAGIVVKAEAEQVEDDDSNKRLSLEQSSPVQEQKALLIFRELLQAAYPPTVLRILADTKHDITSKQSTTNTSTTARNSQVHREEEDVFEEEALGEATDVVTTEFSGTRAAWPGSALQQERRDVCADFAAAVLDALVEETAAELTTGTDGRPRFRG